MSREAGILMPVSSLPGPYGIGDLGETAYAFVDFLAQLRLNYARTMLLTSNLSISHIAQISGFSSSSNFFRAFRKETGLSPLEVRAQNQNKGDTL